MVLKTLLGVLLLVCCATAQELFVTINDGDALGYISAQGTHKVNNYYHFYKHTIWILVH